MHEPIHSCTCFWIPKTNKKVRRTPKTKTKPKGAKLRVGKGALGVVSKAGGSKQSSIRVTRREFLGEWSVPYAIEAYELNPGIPDTFFWAAKMATLWERYQVEYCRFDVVPTCAATSAGMVTIAVDLDPLDPAPSDETEMETRTFWKTGPVREPLSLTVDGASVHRSYKSLYLRNAVLTDADLKTYDFGRFYVTATGPALASAFRVYITYAFRFMDANVERVGDVVMPTTDIPREPAPYTSVVPWRVDSIPDGLSKILKYIPPSMKTSAVGDLGGWVSKWSPVWQAIRNFEGLMRYRGHPRHQPAAHTGMNRLTNFAAYVNQTGFGSPFVQQSVAGWFDKYPTTLWASMDTQHPQSFEIPMKLQKGDYVTIGGAWDEETMPLEDPLFNIGELALVPQTFTGWEDTSTILARVAEKQLQEKVAESNGTHQPLSSQTTLRKK